MSRAWRKLNRKVQIDQRRYYLWMIAVLIGIPVNFIFSGWEEDELACTFAHFSSTWFMWVEYKTLSFFFSPPPFTPHHIPLYQEHIHACTHRHRHTHTRGSKLLPLSCILSGAVYASVCIISVWMFVAVHGVLCICMHVHVFLFVCVCLY